ncbi:MAG TPA: hypothetical protein CFH84_02375 [Sulfurimonas sp. UBA12504]|nr:MAG: hypothetical protein A2019_03960 [Sulfurimonas sp. GWF2_37_8]DAB30767.1 MAG TPA: hypothetical protein CFH84_02375 [Sulfurimonas sp. UBA12504]
MWNSPYTTLYKSVKVLLLLLISAEVENYRSGKIKTVPYAEGMKAGGVVVGEEVKISIELEGILAK